MCAVRKHIRLVLIFFLLAYIGWIGTAAGAEKKEPPLFQRHILLCKLGPQDQAVHPQVPPFLGKPISSKELQRIAGMGGGPQAKDADGSIQSFARIILWDEACMKGTPGLQFSDQGEGQANTQMNSLITGGR